MTNVFLIKITIFFVMPKLVEASLGFCQRDSSAAVGMTNVFLIKITILFSLVMPKLIEASLGFCQRDSSAAVGMTKMKNSK